MQEHLLYFKKSTLQAQVPNFLRFFTQELTLLSYSHFFFSFFLSSSFSRTLPSPECPPFSFPFIFPLITPLPPTFLLTQGTKVYHPLPTPAHISLKSLPYVLHHFQDSRNGVGVPLLLSMQTVLNAFYILRVKRCAPLG